MIEVNNLTRQKIDGNFLKRVAKIALKGENSKVADLSIALVPEKEIKKLNKKYRKENKPTDVLSFEASEFDLSLGEVVICPERVKEDAREFGTTFKKELALVLIHGILHLLGYDHEKGGRQAREMEAKQKHYLSKILNSIF